MRNIRVAAAQLGPIQKADSRQAVVARMLDLMVKYATPGEHHKEMAKRIGEWDYEVQMWMSKDAPPMLSKGTATTRWLIDGMWVLTEMKGSLPRAE